MKNKREVLVKLFLSTLYLSAFTFGGGADHNKSGVCTGLSE